MMSLFRRRSNILFLAALCSYDRLGPHQVLLNPTASVTQDNQAGGAESLGAEPFRGISFVNSDKVPITHSPEGELRA